MNLSSNCDEKMGKCRQQSNNTLEVVFNDDRISCFCLILSGLSSIPGYENTQCWKIVTQSVQALFM
jgi:hypothetical protein